MGVVDLDQNSTRRSSFISRGGREELPDTELAPRLLIRLGSKLCKAPDAGRFIQSLGTMSRDTLSPVLLIVMVDAEC